MRQYFRVCTEPVDLVVVHPDTKDVFMVDVKSETTRALANRPNIYRVARVRSAIQKQLGVRFCYVERDGSLRWVPKLPETLARRLGQ